MTLSYTAVESLFRSGRFEEVVNDWDQHQRVLTTPAHKHQLLVAEALVRTGRLQAAHSIANTVLKRGDCADSHAKCEMILALTARDLGHTDEALQRLQRSVHLAKDQNDTKQAAESALTAFRLVSERQPPEVVSSFLRDTRTLAIQSGDPHLIALLHESVARHEALVGNLGEARRHLKIASSLLETHPNVWLEQLCEINAFCIAFINSDLRHAQAHLSEASRLSAISGTMKDVVSNNFGHLSLQVGQFTESEATLRQVADSRLDEVRQSALDGLARLYLATGRLDYCESTLNELGGLQQRLIGTTSFPVRSSLITRTRLLLRRSRWHEATAAADEAIKEATRVDDRSTLAIALMLQTQSLLGEGRVSDSARTVCKASEIGAWDFREYQGLFANIYSRIQSTPFLRHQSTQRALRIWRQQGNQGAEQEFASPPLEADITSTDRDQLTSTNNALIRSLASAFALAYSPQLLATEVLSIIQTTGCSPDPRVVDTEPPERVPVNHCVVDLTYHNSKPLALVCPVPPEPAKAIVLADVLRLCKAAIDLEKAREEERNRAALWPADPIEEQGGAIFLAEEMREILAVIRRIAPTNVPVLITGETGTGKEIIARTIHAYSARSQSIFLPFNCTSAPKDMIDSQLFGYRRGAFTGAVDHFSGVVRAAAGGTLFLDEIGDTSLDVQPKLLRFLESNEIHPIGETQPVRVDVRLIVATNADLNRLVSHRRFREDLYYRLSIVRLHVPPLRERRVEIPSLANYYLDKHALEYQKGDLRLAEETMEYLVLYKWPGNVRQLANEMRRLAALAEVGAVLMPEHLHSDITASRRTISTGERYLLPTEVVVRLDQPMAAAVHHLEQAMIQHALKKCGGRIEETASMLGLSRKGLYLKRQRFGIDLPASQSAVLGV